MAALRLTVLDPPGLTPVPPPLDEIGTSVERSVEP